MKQKFFLQSLMAGFITVVLISSCTKDATKQIPPPPPPPPKVLNLIAEHWQQQSFEQVYMDDLTGVMQGRTNSLKVFIETGDTEILISSVSIKYMGGEVWSATTGSDLIIYYHNFFGQGVPFGYLNIKVVFE